MKRINERNVHIHPKKGRKTMAEIKSTSKNILKEDENPKKESVNINETNCPNYDVTTTEVTNLKKT